MAIGQRRLTTIVAADVAGYSRLVGADEEGTLDAMRAHRQELVSPLLEQYGGRIANTAGDSFLLEFSSAVDAVRCAVAVQDGMADRNKDIPQDKCIEFRIGINVGDVMAEGEDLLGDGVNVAARLEELAEPNGIYLSRTARDQVRDRLDIPMEDLGEVEVKNIVRPVRVFRIQNVNQSDIPKETRSDQHSDSRKNRAAANRPNVAVLPFSNLDGSSEIVAICDGLTEDIITELSRQQNIEVVARNTMFSYRGKTVKIRDVGLELNADYLLEGSIRMSGQRIRVTAQLIEATTEKHIWAERYDRSQADIFDLQDELSRRIAIAVDLQIFEYERETAHEDPSKELSVEELQRLGQKEFYRFSPEANMIARDYYSRALAIEPDNHSLNVSMAWSYVMEAGFGQGDNWEGAGPLSLEYASKATELNPHAYASHHILGVAFACCGNHLRAQQTLRRALEMNPNNTDAMVHLADTLSATGQYKEAIELSRTAIDLSTEPGFYHYNCGRQLMYAGHYEEAIEEIGKYISGLPGVSEITISICLYALGRVDEAKAFAAEARRISPRYPFAAEINDYRFPDLRQKKEMEQVLHDLGYEL